MSGEEGGTVLSGQLLQCTQCEAHTLCESTAQRGPVWRATAFALPHSAGEARTQPEDSAEYTQTQQYESLSKGGESWVSFPSLSLSLSLSLSHTHTHSNTHRYNTDTNLYVSTYKHRYAETDTDTDRYTDRKTDKQADRKIERQAKRLTETHTHTHTQSIWNCEQDTTSPTPRVVINPSTPLRFFGTLRGSPVMACRS